MNNLACKVQSIKVIKNVEIQNRESIPDPLFLNIDSSLIETPAYVVSESLLQQNLEVLARVQEETGVKILLAQKCFSMFHFYPLIEKYLCGTAASGLFEARLAHEYFHGENHVYSPAYKTEDIKELAKICGHVIFNSFNQVEKFAHVVKSRHHQVGLRINPEH